MPFGILSFLVADAIFLIAFILLVVAAFRVRVLYGFLVLLMPFGALAFAIKYPKEGGLRFLVSLLSYVAVTFIVATNPQLHMPVGRYFPMAKVVAEALGTSDGPARGASGSDLAPQAPRAARDLADTGTSSVPPGARPIPPPVDPFAAQRAACARHAADLNALYAELNKARAKLKKGSPEIAAFNVKAAKYQEGLRTLAAEQAQIDALDHPAAAAAASAQSVPAAGDPKEAEANAALARLRATAAQGDYAAFADTLKHCLADYRQTAAFPQIAATARGTLANAAPEKLAVAIQAQGTAARNEMDTAMGQVRGIVNQTPPVVPKPPRGAQVKIYDYHPGALTPDFAHADLYSTRELWAGDFVCMETAQNVYYRSADCEFNPQTKFFFTARNVPKKKLTDGEIAEIVRLYRIIASDQRLVAALPQRLHDAQGASADLLALNKQLAASR